MRLSRVVIENFRRLERVELDLTEPGGGASPFAAIVGPNASGKTSILEAIALGLRTAESGGDHVWTQGTVIELTVAGSPPPPIGIRHNKVRRGSEAVQAWARRCIVVPAAREVVFQPRFGGGSAASPALDSAWYAQQRRAESVLTRWVAHKLNGLPLDHLWEALSPFLGDRSFDGFHEDTLEPRFRDPDGHTVRFEHLSGGQRKLILLFAEIEMRCGKDGLVLFDEPEVHLHPSWQLQMRTALQALVPDGQVIVATHSPYVIDGMPPHQLFELGPVDPTRAWTGGP